MDTRVSFLPKAIQLMQKKPSHNSFYGTVLFYGQLLSLPIWALDFPYIL